MCKVLVFNRKMRLNLREKMEILKLFGDRFRSSREVATEFNPSYRKNFKKPGDTTVFFIFVRS